MTAADASNVTYEEGTANSHGIRDPSEWTQYLHGPTLFGY